METEKNIPCFDETKKNFTITNFLRKKSFLEHYRLNAKLQKKVEKYFGLFDFGHFFCPILKSGKYFSTFFCSFASFFK